MHVMITNYSGHKVDGCNTYSKAVYYATAVEIAAQKLCTRWNSC